MSNNVHDTFVIEPLHYEPKVGAVQGKFTDLRWDETPKKNGALRRDLVLDVELLEKDDAGQPFTVSQAFNFLPRGRGKSDFIKQMASFLETPLTRAQLAGLKKDLVVGKPVIVNYSLNRLGHVVFDRYTPVKPTQPQTT